VSSRVIIRETDGAKSTLLRVLLKMRWKVAQRTSPQPIRKDRGPRLSGGSGFPVTSQLMRLGWPKTQPPHPFEAGFVTNGTASPDSSEPTVIPVETEGETEALLSLPSDSSGAKTFARYRWQAKTAVLRWLGCLAPGDAPVGVVCEQVDDVTLVYPDRLVFQQLKTRDRGSWSATKVCNKKGGLDALIRSYNATRSEGLHVLSTFELWLEGPMSEVRATVAFFSIPSTASKELRIMLVARGLPRKDVEDFLSRLSIKADAPSRGTIDAVLHQSVGALWPSLTHPETELIVERLVAAAEAAQEHSSPTVTVVLQLRAARAWQVTPSDDPPATAAVPQLLSRGALAALTPPRPDESTDDLLQRLARGEGTSAMELKLRRAGAIDTTIERAKDLRARTEIRRQELLASGDSAEKLLRALEDRVLMVGQATATQARLQMTNPVVAARPAEYISSLLLGNLSSLATLDHESLLGGQALLVYGLLCQVSDECRFGWRP
jgi:G:T/U-mismatch repair DNA glycosylase